VGLHSDPGGPQEPGPPRGQEYGRQSAQGQRDSAGPGSTVLVEDLPTGSLGRDRGGRLLHQRSLDASWAGDLLHALRDRSSEPASPRGRLDPHPGCLVHGAGGAAADRCGRWIPSEPPDPHLRSGQQVDRRIPPHRPRCRGADRVDARSGAECQRLRGTVRALDPTRVSRPPDPVWGAAAAPRPRRVRGALTTGSETIRGSGMR
jgi:hypothetical protein